MSDNLYSRQVGTFGIKTMNKINNLSLIIIGCETIGMECCKSLVLMGINNLYIYDNTIYNSKYYGRLIYKNSKKKYRLDELCSEFLKILNPNINVTILKDIENTTYLSKIIKNQNINGIINTYTFISKKN